MSLSAVRIADLADAFELGSHELVTIVGGGGKTTAVFALGRELGPTAILTTTTKMGRDRRGGYLPLMDPTDAELADAVATQRTVLVWKEGDDRRALGVGSADCDRWFDLVDHVVVEADGSRRRPFKAPLGHEPVVPRRTTTLIACAGAAGFGGVIGEVCHRPERVAELAGCAPSDELTAARLVSVLLDDRGSKKDCPDAARFAILLNQVETVHDRFVSEVAERVGTAARIVAVAPFSPEESPEGT